MYLGRRGEHACGDELVDLNGGLGHELCQWLHVLVKVLQLLADHRAKDATDLTVLLSG